MSGDRGRVLVTGGAGFIGSHLVEHLLADSSTTSVRVLDNLVNGSVANLGALGRDQRLSLISGDIRDPSVVAEACEGCDAVFHLACLGVRHSLHSPMENHRVNAEGTLNLLLASERASVSCFVHVSSSEVFGTARLPAIDEAHVTWPETVYGGSKLAGEAYARAFFRTYGLPVVVVRPFNTYGPRSHFEGDCGEVIPRTIVRVLCGLPPLVFGDGQQTRDFLHVSDTVRALAELADCPAAVGETINVGSGTEVTIEAVCRMIAEIADRPDLRPLHTDPRPGDVRRLKVDNAAVERLVGFSPRVTLEEGLRETVAWFAEHPLSPERMLAQVSDRNWVADAGLPVH